jgi:hypothetical protein
MSKRKIEEVVAELAPKPDVPSRVRRLPAARTSAAASSTHQISQVVASQDAPAAAAVPLTAFALQSPELSSQVAPAAATPSVTFALQSPRARASTRPLSPGRFKLELTLGQDAHDKLEQLRECCDIRTRAAI